MSRRTSGSYIDGKWVSYYDQGYNAYFDGYQFRAASAWQWQQGWRAALNNDIKLANQCYKPSVVAKIQARVNKALGLPNVTACNYGGHAA